MQAILQAILDERVLATILGASVTAVVAITLWVGNKWWERKRADILRAEKITDIMRALLSEIEAYVYLLSSDDLDAHMIMMTQQIEASPDGGFVPVVPRESHDTVYRAFLGEIHVLPGEVVNPVVRYFSQVTAIANFAADMGEDRFAKISNHRMAAMYRHFIVMKKIAREMGEEAREALREALDLQYTPFSRPIQGGSNLG